MLQASEIKMQTYSIDEIEVFFFLLVMFNSYGNVFKMIDQLSL